MYPEWHGYRSGSAGRNPVTDARSMAAVRRAGRWPAMTVPLDVITALFTGRWPEESDGGTEHYNGGAENGSDAEAAVPNTGTDNRILQGHREFVCHRSKATCR